MISLLVILSSAKVCGGRNCLTSKIDRDQYSQTYGYHKVKFSANSNVNANFDISLDVSVRMRIETTQTTSAVWLICCAEVR